MRRHFISRFTVDRTRRVAAVIGALCVAGFAPVTRAQEEDDAFGISVGEPVTAQREALVSLVRKDGIPALTNPPFIPAADATWLSDDARVLGLVHAGVAKAYPIEILLWHEAVNDVIGEQPYLVTY